MEVRNFTHNELQALHAMRITYDALYRQTLSGTYGSYAPVGALIPLILTAWEPIKKWNFTKEDHKAIYDKYVNHAYLSLAKAIARAILDQGLNLIDNQTRVPWEKRKLRQTVKNLIDEKNDNFIGVMASLVAYEHLEHALIKCGLSSDDPIIKVIQQISTEMKKGEPLKQNNTASKAMWQENKILYTPIKDCVNNSSNLINTMLQTIQASDQPSKNYKIIRTYLEHMRMTGFELTENRTTPKFISYISRNLLDPVLKLTTEYIHFTDQTKIKKTAFAQAILRITKK